MRLTALLLAAALGLTAGVALSEETPYDLTLDVVQQDNQFETRASFRLPLSPCQAWQYITDYDDATSIPGIVSSKTTRLEPGKIRVERMLRDTLLLFPIRMRTVMDFTEVAGKGTDFVQVEGQAKAHRGSWRLEGGPEGTVFRYQAVSEPDSALPMAVIRFFLDKRLRNGFLAMAHNGARRKDQACAETARSR